MSDSSSPKPISLSGVSVTEAQEAAVRAHIDALSKTALKVADRLPLHADVSDFVRVLEREAK